MNFPATVLTDSDIQAIKANMQGEGIYLSWVPNAGSISYFGFHRDPYAN